MIKLLLILLLFIVPVSSQKKDPDKILSEVIRNFEKVKDYKVDVSVKVDVPFIKAPDTEAKIYFKQPDKIHFASEKFALVPKEGLDFSPMGLLKTDYTAIFVKDEQLNGTSHSVVKVIPIENNGEIVLSTLWINDKTKAISKVESSTKVSGTFLMELFYENNLKYPLPSKMIFSFNIKNPSSRSEHNDQDENTKPEKGKEEFSGKVFITYKNYEVNTGLSDSIFEQKKK
jgi:hypothetical protein